MTDETETPEGEPEELLFYEGGQLLSDQRWSHYSNTHSEISAYLATKAEIEGKMAKGEPVYVQIMDERRKGSVGRLSTITFDYRAPNTGNGYWNRNQHYLGIHSIEVVWDKRKNKCSPSSSEVEYLPNWTGGTEWQWTKGAAKEKPEPIIAHDHLGQELEIGQFVCFVHRLYGRVSMKFGTVTRFTASGTVFVKTLKLRDGTKGGEELKALSMEDVVICNDKLMARLVMARLSAD